jgi:type II secretion system protein C
LETVRWLLVCGLAFYLADAANAGLERRWASAPVPIAPVKAPLVSASGALPVSHDLVELLATTEPEQLSVTAASSQGVAPGKPQEGTLSLTLVGSMAGPEGAGVAMLTVGGESVVAGTGDMVKDWKVEGVYATSVELERKGEKRSIEMYGTATIPTAMATVPAAASTKVAAVSGTSPAAGQRGARKPANPGGPKGPDAAATPAGPVEPLTSQKELVALLNNPGAISKQGSVKSVNRKGEIIGYQIKIKDPAFPLARLGLRTGDIVTSLNGMPANGPEGLSKIYRSLRNATSLRFAIERNGQPTTVQVDLD